MTLRKILNEYKWANSLWNGCMNLFSSIEWRRTFAFLNKGLYYSLKESDHDLIRMLLKEHYCLILTRRKCCLSTYMITLGSLITIGKSSHWTHTLMNLEGDIVNNVDFKLIEATSKGVHYSTFMEVFDVDSIVLLKPRDISLLEWTLVLDKVKSDYGKEYDTLFDIYSEQNVSCIELIYHGLKKLPDYQQRFPKLIEMVNSAKNITPQMLYDCEELEIVFETRR